MKRIMVTGGNGYIGHYIVSALRKDGWEVYVTSRKEPTDPYCKTMDLLNTSTIQGICKDMDAVVHLANMDERLVKKQGRDALLANTFATRELYRDAIEHGVKKFIYFSTFHVYGKSFGNIDEDTVPKPKSDYGMTHYFAEQYLEQLSDESDAEVAIIRLTNGIGVPFDVDKWYLVLNDFCRTVYETNEIVLESNGLPVRDFVAMHDVASAVEVLLERPNGVGAQVYNLSGEKTYSIRDIALQVSEAYEKRFHKKANIRMPSVTAEEIAAVRPLKRCSRKLRCLGWNSQHSMNEVISEIFDYLEQNM